MPKTYVRLICLCSLLIGIGNLAGAQQIWISCQAQDFRSGQLLAASWQWSDSTHSVVIEQKPLINGFTGFVSKQARFLTVSCQNYRSVRLPVHWSLIQTDSVSFRFRIPMVPVDKPTKNQPYFQSEQHPLKMAESANQHRRIAAQFVILDALTNRPVSAEVCLFFTKENRRTCLVTNSLRTELLKSDIVALEVRAPGFQPYLGNLVVADSARQATTIYRINLNPTPTLLVGYLSSAVTAGTIGLRSTDNRFRQPVARSDSVHFSVAAPPGIYQLTGIRKGDANVDHTIRLAEGLTGYAVSAHPKQQPDTRAETVIYFTQSSYELTDSAKLTLDRLFLILQQHPQQTLRIVGHTDAVGNPQLNLTLSEFRAKITRAYLERKGIRTERLHLEAMGAARPVAPNDSEENRRYNRRVSLSIH